MARGQLLLETESVDMTDAQHKDETLFPAWLHVLKRKDDDDEHEEWSGRIQAISRKLDEQDKTQGEMQKETQKHMEAMVEAALSKPTAELRALKEANEKQAAELKVEQGGAGVSTA